MLNIKWTDIIAFGGRALPRPAGELKRSPRPLAAYTGEWRGAKNTFTPGAQHPRAATACQVYYLNIFHLFVDN